MAVGNLSSYIKTPAPPLSKPSFHHISKAYTSGTHHSLLLLLLLLHYHTSTLNHISIPQPYRYQPSSTSTQWPLLPTTSPPWLATTSLPARDHHQHALCPRCPPNKLGRHANRLLVYSFQASTGVLAPLNIDIYYIIPTNPDIIPWQALMHSTAHDQHDPIFDDAVYFPRSQRNTAG